MMGPNPVASAMNGQASAAERPQQIASVAPPTAPPASPPANLGNLMPQQAAAQPTHYQTQQVQQQQAQAQQQAQQQQAQAQQQAQQQPSFQDMMRFFQQMQQQGYGPPQQQYQPQPMPQGAQARMQMQQQNPFARAPQPATAYAPQAPAAQVQLVQAMPARAPVSPMQASGASAAEMPGQRVTASAAELPNPIHQAMQQPAGLAMSDETQKVVSEPSLADAFLEHMKPYSYKYKDPRMEPRVAPTGGTYLGVMAQDLERIPHLGQQLVVDTPHGKMVDQKTALSATMAGLARVFERVKALESDALKGRK